MEQNEPSMRYSDLSGYVYNQFILGFAEVTKCFQISVPSGKIFYLSLMFHVSCGFTQCLFILGSRPKEESLSGLMALEKEQW